MSARRLTLLLAGLVAALLLLAACGDDDDAIATDDPGSSGLADDGDSSGGADSSGAASGGATRPWIGGDWVLESATGDDGPVTLPDGVPLGLRIQGPDLISGDAGCNIFSGTIDAPFDGDANAGPLSITDMSWTEMACEYLDTETIYLDLLGRVDRWELAPPSGLVFRGDGIELVYGIGDAAPELSIDGPTWVFDTVFDGEGMERTAASTRADLPEVAATFLDSTLTLTAEGCQPVEVNVDYTPGATEGQLDVVDADTLAEQVDCGEAESNLTAAVDGVAISTGFQIFDGRLTLIGLPGETVSFRAADG